MYVYLHTPLYFSLTLTSLPNFFRVSLSFFLCLTPNHSLYLLFTFFYSLIHTHTLSLSLSLCPSLSSFPSLSTYLSHPLSLSLSLSSYLDDGMNLSGSMVASSFGKLVMKERPRDGVKEEDLAIALLMMITNNIGKNRY